MIELISTASDKDVVLRLRVVVEGRPMEVRRELREHIGRHFVP